MFLPIDQYGLSLDIGILTSISCPLPRLREPHREGLERLRALEDGEEYWEMLSPGHDELIRLWSPALDLYEMKPANTLAVLDKGLNQHSSGVG